MYYYLIIALQGFCIYHCYSNRNNYYWFFAIIFLPVIGSLLYLFTNLVQKRDIEKVQDSLVTTLNPTRKIKDLEKKFRFSETFENQVALADAYLEELIYDKAIENYEASLKDVFKNDFYVLSKLQEANFHISKFDESIGFANRIKEHAEFKKSKASFIYGLSLEKNGDIETAEGQLRLFDAPYNYYMERLELARFLVRNNKLNDGITVYREMVNESENMSKLSFRNNKSFIKKAKEELAALNQ